MYGQGGIEDTYTTMSGRSVRLALWSEHENVDQLDWAMASLKQSMQWDEQTYGLEYDRSRRARTHIGHRPWDPT